VRLFYNKEMNNIIEQALIALHHIAAIVITYKGVTFTVVNQTTVVWIATLACPTIVNFPSQVLYSKIVYLCKM
jgi:hypothetical protein